MANRRAACCFIELSEMLDSLRVGEIAPQSSMPYSQGAVKHALTFERLCQLYLDDPTASRTAKSLRGYRSALSVLIEIVGPKTPASAITRATCRELLDVLQKLPTNARKRWPNENLLALDDRAVAKGIKPMSVSNANEYLNKLSTVMNWGIRESHCSVNPAKGLRLPQSVSRKDQRKAFSDQQLQKIFDAPIYRGCQDDQRGYSLEGPNLPRRSRFWVPLIGLFAGLRLNEICQLHVSDVRLVDTVLGLQICADGDDKHLKTSTSERYVALHPELLKIGFRAYLDEVRASNDLRLFQDIKVDTFGMLSGRFSRWFSRFLIVSGASGPKTCFHSFRHNFRDALRNAKVDREIAFALGGWAARNSNAAGDFYGDGPSATVLNEAISQIQYPGLDLTHLRQANGDVSLRRHVRHPGP